MGQQIFDESSRSHLCTECGQSFSCRSCHLPQNLLNKFSSCFKLKNPFKQIDIPEVSVTMTNVPVEDDYFYFCKEECLLHFYNHLMIVQAFLNVIKEMNEEDMRENEETDINVLPWAHA